MQFKSSALVFTLAAAAAACTSAPQQPEGYGQVEGHISCSCDGKTFYEGVSNGQVTKRGGQPIYDFVEKSTGRATSKSGDCKVSYRKAK